MPSPKQEAISFHKTTASVHLDLVRGIAALLVLLSHWKVMFFTDKALIPNHAAWFTIPYLVMEAGHQSVLIFFVLSGYLIGGSVFRSLDRSQWSWRSYLTHRMVRLWIVLIPGILLGGLWDWIGLHLGHAASLYNGTNPKSHQIDVHQTLSLHALVGNLAFLQTILVPCFGSNGALWSLANEFWYYILFPLGWLLVRRSTTASRRILYLVLLLPLLWLLRSSVLRLFPIWLAGTLLARLPVPSFSKSARILASILYTPIVFFFANLHTGHAYREDYAFSVVTLAFFWIILSATDLAGDNIADRLSRQLARFSFTLYIVHMPALLLITAIFVGTSLWSPTDLTHDLFALVVLFFVFAYAYLVAFLTEFRTGQVRARVENLLGPTKPASSRKMPPRESPKESPEPVAQ